MNWSFMRSQMPIVRSPCTFECPRTGHGPAPRPTDVAAEQQKIHHFLNGGDRVLVLRQPHRPATDDALALHRDLGGLADLFARQATAAKDLVPRRRAKMLEERFELPLRVLAMNSRSKTAPGPLLLLGQHFLHDPAQRRHVAIDPHRQPKIGESAPVIRTAA